MQRSRHMLPAPPWLPLGLDCRGPLTASTTRRQASYTNKLAVVSLAARLADLMSRFRVRADDVAASCDGVARLPSLLTSLVQSRPPCGGDHRPAMSDHCRQFPPLLSPQPPTTSTVQGTCTEVPPVLYCPRFERGRTGRQAGKQGGWWKGAPRPARLVPDRLGAPATATMASQSHTPRASRRQPNHGLMGAPSRHQEKTRSGRGRARPLHACGIQHLPTSCQLCCFVWSWPETTQSPAIAHPATQLPSCPAAPLYHS